MGRLCSYAKLGSAEMNSCTYSLLLFTWPVFVYSWNKLIVLSCLIFLSLCTAVFTAGQWYFGFPPSSKNATFFVDQSLYFCYIKCVFTCFVSFLLQIIRDGMHEESPTEYPKADTQGSKQRFIFRTTKFNHTVVFDPTLSVGEAAEEPPTTTPTSQASSIQFIVAMLLISLIALFM